MDIAGFFTSGITTGRLGGLRTTLVGAVGAPVLMLIFFIVALAISFGFVRGFVVSPFHKRYFIKWMILSIFLWIFLMYF